MYEIKVQMCWNITANEKGNFSFNFFSNIK